MKNLFNENCLNDNKQGVLVMQYIIIVILLLCGIIWGCNECKAKKTNNERQEISVMLSDVKSVSYTRTIAYTDPTQTEDGISEIYALADRYGTDREGLLGIISSDISAITEKLSKEGFKVVDRSGSKLNKIMEEHEFQMSEWSAEKKVAEVGKGANADLILTFVPRLTSSDSSVYASVSAEFIDINTMQTFNFNYNGTSFSNWNFALLKVNADSPNGAWFCDGLKKSSIKYTSEKVKYITPFAGNYALNSTNKLEKKKYFNEEITRITISDDEGTIIYSNGKEVECYVTFNLEKDSNFSVDKVTGQNYLDDNVKVYANSDSGVSTMKIGTLTIRDEFGKQFLKGTVYRKGNEMGILVGTSAKDGSGIAYFVMFSK